MTSKLSSLLVQAGIVSVKRMEEAFQRQVIFGGSLDTILLEMGVVDEATLIGYLQAATGIGSIDLKEIDFIESRSETTLFPAALANKHLVAPLRLLPGGVLVLVADPFDPEKLAALAQTVGVKLEPAVVPECRLYQALEQLYGGRMPLRYSGLTKRLGDPPDPPAPATPGGPEPEPKKKPADGPGAPVETPDEVDTSAEDDDATAAEPAVSSTEPAIPEADPPTAPTRSASMGLPPSFDPSPLDVAEAIEAMRAARTRDEIYGLLLRALTNYFEFSAIFTVYSDQAVGRMAIRDGRADQSSIAQVAIPLQLPSIFQSIAETRGYYFGPIYDEGINFTVLAELDRPVPPSAFIMPVLIRNRMVCFLYADHGLREVDPTLAEKLVLLSHQISQSFQSLILRAKRGEYSSALARPGDPGKLRAVAELVSPSTAQLSRPVPWGLAEDEEGPEATRAPSQDGALKEALDLPLAPPDPPPAAVAQARSPGAYRLTNPDIEDSLATEPPVTDPPPVPHDAPATAATAAKGAADRALDRDALRDLVEELDLGGDYGTQAARALVQAGEEGLRLVANRFPGRRDPDKVGDRGKLPPPSQHGPLIQFMVSMGDDAVPHLVPLMDSDEPETRFYATYIFTELVAAEAVEGLLNRVFDAAPPVRRAALEALLTHGRVMDLGWVLDRLRAEIAGKIPFRQRCGTEALGVMRDAGAVPALIPLAAGTDARVGSAAQHALFLITKQRFGDSLSRWTAWLDHFGPRHRVEWLIEALEHQDFESRREAIGELEILVGERLGFDPGGEPEARSQVIKQWRGWWSQAGRAHFLAD